MHIQPTNWSKDTTQRRVNLVQELRTLSRVAAASNSFLPATSGYSSRVATYQTDTSEVEVQIYVKQGDTSFLDVFDIELLAGRNYRASDTLNEVLINETTAKALGFTPLTQAIGNTIRVNNRTHPVVGVVRDFHDGPLYTKIRPLVIGAKEPRYIANINIRLASSGKQASAIQESLAQIEQVYKQFYPEEPFEYKFYDETIAGFYKSDQRTARLINVTTGLAIFISCLGLLGLVSFTTNQRIKEIGIRKVLGATVTQLIALFSREFAGLVLLSFVIAGPLAWYFAQEWLSGFAYRTDMGVVTFLLTILSALGLALLTVGLRSWQASLANPVDSLRNE